MPKKKWGERGARDMKGTLIKEGMKVNKHSIINDDTSSFKTGTVDEVSPMHGGGDDMVWAGSGGAHHPKACVVVSEE